MWSVSGLSCRKSGSCHSHIDDGVCLCSHWNHLFLSSSFMCIYAMNWMIFFFLFSLVVFDGLMITSLRVFVNTFLCFLPLFLFIRFVMCLYFIICLYFLLFSVNLGCCVGVGMLRRDGRKGREGRVRLRRSSASKAAGILLKPLKKSQNSLTLKQLGFFQQRSLPAA